MGRAMNYLEAPDSPAGEQIKSIFDVVRDYTYALDTLDSYDYQTLSIRSTSKECFHATYENARAVIEDLKHKFGESRNAALPRREEPFILRRQQTHRGNTLPVVHGEQPHPVLVRRAQAHSGQRIGSPDLDDC